MSVRIRFLQIAIFFSLLKIKSCNKSYATLRQVPVLFTNAEVRLKEQMKERISNLNTELKTEISDSKTQMLQAIAG